MSRRPVRRSERIAVVSLVALAIGAAACTPSAAPSVPSPVLTAAPTTTAEMSRPPVETAGAPIAAAAVEGGDPVTGQLGSYTFAGTGAESPWLHGAPIRIGQGERITVALQPAVPIATWSARYVPSEATGPDGAIGLGQGAGLASFGPPPPGSWTVEVRVTFSAAQGDARYYWTVEVD